jgi:hypothetical protein
MLQRTHCGVYGRRGQPESESESESDEEVEVVKSKWSTALTVAEVMEKAYGELSSLKHELEELTVDAAIESDDCKGRVAVIKHEIAAYEIKLREYEAELARGDA